MHIIFPLFPSSPSSLTDMTFSLHPPQLHSVLLSPFLGERAFKLEEEEEGEICIKRAPTQFPAICFLREINGEIPAFPFFPLH